VANTKTKDDEARARAKKAIKTGKWTEILFKALSKRVADRWRFVSFRGMGGGEWRGIVDVLAIRKDTTAPANDLLKSGDLFEIILVQMKGGSARKPKVEDLKRLRLVAERYGAKHVVLFTWNEKKGCKWQTLSESGEWAPSSATALFGAKSKSAAGAVL